MIQERERIVLETLEKVPKQNAILVGGYAVNAYVPPARARLLIESRKFDAFISSITLAEISWIVLARARLASK